MLDIFSLSTGSLLERETYAKRIMAKKRSREHSGNDAELIEIYEDLAHVSEDIRLKAAKFLIQKVSSAGSDFSQHLSRVLERLFRGLCSSRKAARLGFSVALTELLSLHFAPTKTGAQSPDMNEVMDIFEQQTKTGGDVSRTVRPPLQMIFAMLTSIRKLEIITLGVFLVQMY